MFYVPTYYEVGCRGKIDGRYRHMCRVCKTSIQDIPLNPSRSKGHQVKVSYPKGNLPIKQNLPKFVLLQLSAYEVDNVEIENIE